MEHQAVSQGVQGGSVLCLCPGSLFFKLPTQKKGTVRMGAGVPGSQLGGGKCPADALSHHI